MGLFTRHEKRKTFRGILRRIAPALAATAIIGVLGLWHPVAGAVGIAVAAAVAAVRQTRYDPTDTAGPSRAAVTGADLTLVTGAAAALPLAATAGPGGALAIPLVLAITGVAAYRNLAHGSRVAVAVAAMGHAFRHHRRRTLAVWVTAVAAGVAFVWGGVPGASLLAVGLALTPIRAHWTAAREEQRTRRVIEQSLAGLFAGDAWTPVMAGAKRAPIVRLGLAVNGVPERIVLPVPVGQSTGDTWVARKVDDVNNRLRAYDRQWVCDWDWADHTVTITPQSLPTMIEHPGSTQPWNQIPIGVCEDRTEAVIDLTMAPHVLIAGPTGTGKSVLQRNILFHALDTDWRIVGIDPKRVELGWLRKYPQTLKVAMDLEEGVDAVEAVRDEMMRRYDEMEAMGVNHANDLSDPPPPLMLMVDEAYNFLAKEGVKERDALHVRAKTLLGEIARLGRAARVHLFAATQRPDADVLSGELKNNLDCRIAAGRLDSTPSLMILDNSEAGPRLPKIKGRGMIRQGGDLKVFQGYYADPDWYDRRQAAREAGEDVTPSPAQETRRYTSPDSAAVTPPVAPTVTTVTRTSGGTILQGDSDGTRPALTVTRPTLTLDDLGGYETVKAELQRKIGRALTDADTLAQYRIKSDGVLLHGPAGTGKTTLAEAVAGTYGANYLKVTAGDLTGPHVGEGAALIRAAVDAAVEAVPLVLLIDELDAVAPRREGNIGQEGRTSVNELLAQLDRCRNTPGLVVIATTNHLDGLDRAVIRDGRFGAQVRVDLPDAEARQAILKASLADRPTAPETDLDAVVGRTVGYTPARLEGVVNDAALAASADRRPITTEDLLTVIAARGGKDRPTVEGAGLDTLVLPERTVRDLRGIINLLKDPDRATRLGGQPPRGLLLEGPGGTGKTSIARALAAEAGVSFFAVAPGEWTSEWQGIAERRVREVYERARAAAPSIVFIDEVDSVGQSRDGAQSTESGRVLRPLLAEMDGIQSGEGAPMVFTIAATNRADLLDAALTRPGRLTRTVHVGLPDLENRRALWARFTAGTALSADVDLDALAQVTEGCSPALIRGIRDRAVEIVLNRGGDTMTAADIAEALDDLDVPARIRTAP